jgi:hypothetical protein
MVPRRDQQADILVQAVQNHNPDVIIVDEIGTKQVRRGTERLMLMLMTAANASQRSRLMLMPMPTPAADVNQRSSRWSVRLCVTSSDC